MIAPVKHTCPTIDTTILELKDVVVDLRKIKARGRLTKDILDKLIRQVEETSRGDDSKLERLRESNAELRAWVEDTERKCEKWHRQYHESATRVEHLEMQIRNLEMQLMEH